MFLFNKKEKPLERQEEGAVQEEKAEEKEEGEKNSIIPEKGISMICKYRVEAGLEFITYIKGELIKTVVPVNGDENHSLFRDGKVYQWSTKQKRGFFISLEEAKKQPGTEIKDPEKYLDDIKIKYKPDCQKTDISDSIFALPSDVQFEEIGKLLQR